MRLCRVRADPGKPRQPAAIVNNEGTYTFNYVASQQNQYNGNPRACEDGVSEYDNNGQIICGTVRQTNVSQTFTEQGHTYTVNDMFRVNYDNGANLSKETAARRPLTVPR